ncbi:MAG: cyclic 2,3-diphosphoglycerate synthase [Candidatus Muiribacteriota bacterium]
MAARRVLIMGAAGRDFHNFNTVYRDNKNYEVVCFTATQIPDIDGRKYPKELAGKNYPKGIPIYSEDNLEELIIKNKIDDVVFSYSDVNYEYVMRRAAIVNATGANFVMLGAAETMIKSKKPVISICATRTGCGKSQTTRKICNLLKAAGKKVVAVRHPMPYGDLVKQEVQRFATLKDLDKHKCTIEEREEYEPHVKNNTIIYAGVDYEKILREAEKEADIILWDGGNNDMPFFKPDVEVVVVDPHRAGDEIYYYPGEVNLRRADIIVINKIDSADGEMITELRENIRSANSKAIVVDAASPLLVEGYEKIKGKKVLVIEDGPTLTHGEMEYGAGIIAAEKYGAAEIIDPRPYVVGEIKKTFEKYPYIGTLLPAMGYSDKQIKDLEKSVNKTECELVIIATPINLTKLIKINKPMVFVSYELQEIGHPDLAETLKKFLK